jgi:1-acyl-sn-glycerol-3-phosphate acyltransferase
MRGHVLPVLLEFAGVDPVMSAPRPGSANPHFRPNFYAAGKFVTGKAFDILWRREVYGRENIPAPGQGVIFAANHRSLADPNLVGSAIPYPIHYFAKDELFKVPLLGWYIRRVNAFPVKRAEHDIGAFKTAQRILEKGEGLLLFPEGGRRLDPRRQFVARAGVGMLACKTGALVCPVGVIGSEHFPKLVRVQVHFGPCLRPPDNPTRDDYQRFSDLVMEKVRGLCGVGPKA